ncbi:hypothetical protein [Niveispirillum sp. KHB5.9]|uniref:hypothetical protein n=1 Tax=Niveispirillum sp. KHB5.9 TaxID=3400269 RepID=UPI003A8947A0
MADISLRGVYWLEWDMRNIGLMVGLALLAVSGAGAQEAEKPAMSEPIVQTAPAKDDGSRLVCKTEKETGSRVKRNKICKTKQEWNEMRQNTNKQLDEYGKQAPPNPLPSTSG